MNRQLRYFSIVFCLLFSSSNLHSQFSSLKEAIPTPLSSENIVKHSTYILEYSEQHEQARWVLYQLTREEVAGTIERTDNFREDPLVKTGSASLADYKGSGFDRGHLAPAADFKWSGIAMSESFFMSNMSPQVPGFNRGIWSSLEAQVRNWAVDNEEIYIVTGPVLTSNLSAIGPNKVTVPEYYYKVILDYKEPEIKGIGLILRNESSRKPLQDFAIPIDLVEKFTGIDFFPALPDDIENNIESNINIDLWSFGKSQTNNLKSTTSTAVQCKGITQKGVRCKRMTKDPSGYCWQHQSQTKSSQIQKQESTSKQEQKSVTVYITKTGKKYHRGSCSSLRKSKIPISLSDAKKRGYTPCSRCKPEK